MDKKYDVITAMDLCIDFLVSMGKTVPEFGQKELMIEDYKTEVGGSACIFASQCAKLGLNAAGTGRLGEDLFGTQALQGLKEIGIHTEEIEVSGDVRTGVGIALNRENGDRSILTYMGSIGEVNREGFQKLARETRHIHIASYFLISGMQPLYRELLPEVKKHGVTVSLDTNWDPEETWDSGLKEILPYVDILLQNEQEMTALAGTDSLNEAVNKLLKQIPIVVLKKGSQGAAAYTKQKTCERRTVPVKPVDTVGAGDSFDGGFVYGYLKGLPLEKCLEIGCMCGTGNVTAAGGMKGQPTWKDLNLNR